MKLLLENVEGQVYVDGEPMYVRVAVEIDLDHMGDVVRRAYSNYRGRALWAGGAFRAFVQDEGEGR